MRESFGESLGDLLEEVGESLGDSLEELLPMSNRPLVKLFESG